MKVGWSETCPVCSADDVIKARQQVRKRAQELAFSIVELTKIVTAASEIARNTLDYGGGGTMTIETVTSASGRTGIRLVFDDHGPGIADVEKALKDGFTTGTGLGLGLGGAKRLSNEFDIESRPGGGTRVTLVRWK